MCPVGAEVREWRGSGGGGEDREGVVGGFGEGGLEALPEVQPGYVDGLAGAAGSYGLGDGQGEDGAEPAEGGVGTKGA